MKHRINVKGVIIPNEDKWIYDMFDIESTCPKDITEAIKLSEGKPLDVWINSGGGSVFDASEIYTELKSYEAGVDTTIAGLAASAASVIAMAGTNCRMAPTAELMIHNSSTVAWGDYHQMEKAAEMLQVTNRTISNAYRIKSGLSEEELLSLMDKETWLTPQDALEKGFIDEIMFENSAVKAVASTGVQSMIPQKVIDGLRNKVGNKQQVIPNNHDPLSKDDVAKMIQDALAQLKPTNKEPIADPVPEPKQNLGSLFLNLGGKR